MVICSVYIEFMCFFSAVKSKLLWKETQLEKQQLLLCLLSIVLVHPSFTRNLSALLGKSFNKHNSAIWHVFSLPARITGCFSLTLLWDHVLAKLPLHDVSACVCQGISSVKTWPSQSTRREHKPNSRSSSGVISISRPVGTKDATLPGLPFKRRVR